jgi:hypothetical protein
MIGKKLQSLKQLEVLEKQDGSGETGMPENGGRDVARLNKYS